MIATRLSGRKSSLRGAHTIYSQGPRQPDALPAGRPYNTYCLAAMKPTRRMAELQESPPSRGRRAGSSLWVGKKQVSAHSYKHSVSIQDVYCHI